MHDARGREPHHTTHTSSFAEDAPLIDHPLNPGVSNGKAEIRIGITQTVTFARVDPDGAYRIARVPPGDYTLRVWSAELAGVVGQLQVGVATETSQTIWLDPAKISP